MAWALAGGGNGRAASEGKKLRLPASRFVSVRSHDEPRTRERQREVQVKWQARRAWGDRSWRDRSCGVLWGTRPYSHLSLSLSLGQDIETMAGEAITLCLLVIAFLFPLLANLVVWTPRGCVKLPRRGSLWCLPLPPRCLFQQVVCAIIFCSPRSVVVPSHARCCCRCKPLEARTQLDDPSAALSSSCNAAEMDHAPGGDDGDSKKPARQYGKRLDRGGAGGRREGGWAKASHVPYRTYGKYMRIWVACVCL